MGDNQALVSAWEVEPISTLLQQIHYQYLTKGLKSITVASELRSEGKTTVAVTMARGLAEVFKFKVLYVDLNPQGDSLLSKHLKDYHSKDGMVLDHQFPFSILRIKDLEIDWMKNSFDGPFLNRLVTGNTNNFDLIIVDSFNPSNAQESVLKVNTDTNLIVKSPSTKSDLIENEIERDRKKLIGIIFNEN
jgi:cellulose biosynthesis protein BcsQ